MVVRFAARGLPRIPGVLAIILMNLLAFDQHFAVAVEQPIIIPEIFHRWRLPGDENKPGITIDEISKCMQARELYDYLIREGAELEHASGEVAKEMESVRSRQTEIQAADAKLGDSVRGFNERGEALERRRADIERARKTIQGAAEVKAFNDRVALFNKEVAAHQRQDGVLKSALKEHADKVAGYNGIVGRSNRIIAAYNARVAPYKAEAEQFEQLQADYKQRCVGERRFTR